MVAAHAGFCFGVRRAVEAAEKSAPALSLGPVIHNAQTVERLDALGVHAVDEMEEIPEDSRVIVRARRELRGDGSAEEKAL